MEVRSKLRLVCGCRVAFKVSGGRGRVKGEGRVGAEVGHKKICTNVWGPQTALETFGGETEPRDSGLFSGCSAKGIYEGRPDALKRLFFCQHYAGS